MAPKIEWGPESKVKVIFTMNRITAATIFVILISFVMVLAITWGVEYNWPDYVHVNYGFPLVWGIHTLNTIHGPVDIWHVNLMFLAADLAIWLLVLIVGLILILYYGVGVKVR